MVRRPGARGDVAESFGTTTAPRPECATIFDAGAADETSRGKRSLGANASEGSILRWFRDVWRLSLMVSGLVTGEIVAGIAGWRG
jgi:hypothetical protein